MNIMVASASDLITNHPAYVMETMRNYTNLSTKDIRMSMRRFKLLYNFIKISGIEDGFE